MIDKNKIRVLAKRTFNAPLGTRLIVKGVELLLDLYEAKELQKMGLVEYVSEDEKKPKEVSEQPIKVTKGRPRTKKLEPLNKQIEQSQDQ